MKLKGMRGFTMMLLAAWPPVAAVAQVLPWDTFADSESDSICDVVNAENTELVVLSSTGELQVLGGDIVPFSFVDAIGSVYIETEPFGFIEFRTDGDGFRTLWWLTSTGRVVAIDEFTLEPLPTNLLPTDFEDVPCDACTVLDDPVLCGCLSAADCDDGDVCTDDFCLNGDCTHVFNRAPCSDGDTCTAGDECFNGVCAGVSVCECRSAADCADGDICTDEVCLDGECVYVDNTAPCNDGDSCTTDDSCFGGVCAGFEIAGCGSPPPIRISFCGTNLAAILPLTLGGLLAMGLVRRRSA